MFFLVPEVFSHVLAGFRRATACCTGALAVPDPPAARAAVLCGPSRGGGLCSGWMAAQLAQKNKNIKKNTHAGVALIFVLIR